MKSFYLGLITCFILLLCSFSTVHARSGCCSHHGGVCGCSCCDGTSLSAKCAPYYPGCNSNKVQNVISPKPTTKPTSDNLGVSNNDNKTVDANQALTTNDSYSESSSGILSLLVMGALGYGAYRFGKNRGKNEKPKE